MSEATGEGPRAVIVISSHVARGSVGNRAAVFALETLGFPVWAVAASPSARNACSRRCESTRWVSSEHMHSTPPVLSSSSGIRL